MALDTLTWHMSGLATKTGTNENALFADMKTAFDANNGNSDFKWTVASSNVASTPYYIVLKRKNGSAGRILLLSYTSPPSTNPTLFSFNPSTGRFFVAYFPNGSVDTPSNLNATSGVILGNDTGCTMAAWIGAPTTIYNANIQFYYSDCEEGCGFFFQNPGVANVVYGGIAGNLMVDLADTNAYPTAMGVGTSIGLLSIGNTTGFSYIGFTAGGIVPGTGQSGVRVYKGGASRDAFQAFNPTGWASQPISANDILTDTSNSKAYFCPIMFLTGTKGEGITMKLRQIAHGPQGVGAFPVYNETGPTVVAYCPTPCTTAVTGLFWLLNKKI